MTTYYLEILLPWRIFNIDTKTSAWLANTVVSSDSVATSIILSDRVHVEVWSRCWDPVTGVTGDVSATLLAPWIFSDVRITFCIDCEYIGAVHFEIDFFYCINELWLIWKLKSYFGAFAIGKIDLSNWLPNLFNKFWLWSSGQVLIVFSNHCTFRKM